EVLASLHIPESVTNTFKDYQLHPSLLDAAIGVGVVLHWLPGTNASSPMLPFALDEMRILKPCTAKMWAWVRRNTTDAAIQKFDIDLCDEAGSVSVEMRGFTARVLEETTKLVVAQVATDVEALSYDKDKVNNDILRDKAMS